MHKIPDWSLILEIEQAMEILNKSSGHDIIQWPSKLSPELQKLAGEVGPTEIY
jgi:hypothetical protein